jgi:ribonuclease D
MSEIVEQMVLRPQELSACCQYLASEKRFGFDTEFVGEDSYHPHLCLVQVATRERLFLVDPLTVGPLDVFWQLVTDPSNQVVVHAGREEVRLCRLWTGRVPGDIFDLQIAAGLIGLPYPLGHAALVSQVLGERIPKAETLTEWRDRPLSERQIRYAFDDVRYLLPLWQRLSSKLEALGRQEWAHEEFARLASSALPSENDNEKWRKIRGLASLDRRQLAIARELCRWREELAAQMNRPARTIVRDDLLAEIARRNPSRERDLQAVRGLARRHLTAIVDAVRQARSIPLEQCPELAEREQDLPQVPLITNVLTAVLGSGCASRRLAPGLVANSQDLKNLVRGRLQGGRSSPDSLLTQGWRAKEVLPELLAVLEGRASVRITDIDAEAPISVNTSD